MSYLYIASMAAPTYGSPDPMTAPTGREGANGILSNMVNLFKKNLCVPCALVRKKRVSHRDTKTRGRKTTFISFTEH